jgi:hypothetical protein
MVSPVLTEARWSGEFLVSEANNTALARSGDAEAADLCCAGRYYSVRRHGARQIRCIRRRAHLCRDGRQHRQLVTCGAVVESAGAKLGVYKIEIHRGDGVFNVYDPNGASCRRRQDRRGLRGGGLAFTITAGGTPAVAGVTAARSPWRRMPMRGNTVRSIWRPRMGCRTAAAILFNTVDASAGDTKATVITRAAEVNGSELTYPAAATANQIAAINAQLSVLGIRSARHNSQENLGSTSPHPNPLPRWGRGGVS